MVYILIYTAHVQKADEL